LLVNLLSFYPEAPARPPTLEVVRARECAPILSPFIVFTFKFVVESIKELGGASMVVILHEVAVTILQEVVVVDPKKTKIQDHTLQEYKDHG